MTILRDAAGAGDHPFSLSEIVSSIGLREAYRLHDGDQVEVDVPGFPRRWMVEQ